MFGDPIGECDRCGTPGLKLYKYSEQDVCASCRQTMQDEDNAAGPKEELRSLRKVIRHADKNYPYP